LQNGGHISECPADSFLVFEEGPSEDIQLQWATYQDASDQCSLSRIWGGIHPPCDDIPGRKIGYEIGHFAFDHAQSFFDPTPPSVVSAFASDNVVTDEDTPWPLTVTVIYDEPMDPERTPTVSTDVALMGLFLSEMIWTNDSTLLINYTLSDMEEDIDSFSIIVDGAQDYAGNEQTASAIVFAQIDTQNPTIVASDVQEVGAPVTSFVFTFELSETMDTSSTLLLETPVEDALANSLVLSNAHWLDSLTYEMTYELIDAEEEIDLIDIQLSQATDSLGNPMVITSLPDVFSIDTKNPV